MGYPTDFGHGEGVLTTAGRLVQQARSDFDGHATTLDGQITAIRGRWGGAGASAFFILHQAWAEKHRIVVAALEEFATSLEQTERDNLRVDENAGSLLTTLTNRLGQVGA